MKTSRLFVLSIALLALALFSACTPSLSVKVDTITADRADQVKSYYLKSGMQGVGTEDLVFGEFSQYVHRILARQGFKRSESEAQAAMIIELSYGVTSGMPMQYSYSLPIYDTSGGEIITYVETTTDPQTKQTSKTIKTIQLPYRNQLIGHTLETGTRVVYVSYLMLLAKENSKAEKPAVLWRTQVKTQDESGDLRKLVPIMALAAQPYLARNTGSEQTVEIKLDDPRIAQLRAGP